MDKILYNIWHVKNRLLPANPDANPPTAAGLETLTTGTIFQKHNTKFYVSIATLSVNNSIKFLDHLKQGFKRMISWNKYRSEITTQPKIDDLNYMIDPTLGDTNRLFVLSFKNGDDNPAGNSFDEYYMPQVEIKDFDALIANKPFLING